MLECVVESCKISYKKDDEITILRLLSSIFREINPLEDLFHNLACFENKDCNHDFLSMV